MSRSNNGHPMYPFFEYKDFTIWPNPVITRDPEKHFRFMKELKVRNDDVFLCTAFKSGTHWVHEIIAMLLSQSTNYNFKGDLLDSHLEIAEPEEVESLESPRILHSHCPISFNSTKYRKMVIVNRNPKDRHVSSFTFLRGKSGFPDENKWTWPFYFKEHVLKDNFMTGWFNFTREMNGAVNDKKLNIFPLLYEDLILNPKSEIQRLAKFLEVPYTDDFIDGVVEACKFDNLKKHKIDAGLRFSEGGKSTLFRKGKIGDWKNWFTVSQNEQFDAMYKKKMEGVDIKFIFENDDMGDDQQNRHLS